MGPGSLFFKRLTLLSGDLATGLCMHLIANGEYEPKGVTDFDVHEVLWIYDRNA